MNAPEPHFVLVTLWEYVEPADRAEYYEDPLDEMLHAKELGEVVGGGTQMSETCGIESANIEVETNDLEQGVKVIISTLEACGVAKGSTVEFEQGGSKHVVEFGLTECLAIFLDGVDLPDAIYEETDINELAEQILNELEADEKGEIRSSWAGPTETAIFIHGLDAEQLWTQLQA